ncbi:MAG TPA: tripartite tricarboxylate transporter substrate binding protein [Alphaproteobacteria bacterium]|nr:tripartite tricarboxylate transporter substrate binding protein [Alphaproteobacteria bacterium]
MLLRAVIAAYALLALAQPACAEYPTRPIHLLVPFPAGGAVDLVARLLASQLTHDLPGTIVVENKPGAGGILATDATAKATADGYTLLLTTPSHTINAALRATLPYDTEKDLAPVSIVAEIPELLVSSPQAPFDSFKGFVAYAKQHPGQLTYASAGNGTLPHVTMELLLQQAGVQVLHVPYRGAAPAMADLLGGHVQLKLDTIATSAQLVADGKLRALAYAAHARSPLMPEVPTVAEMGLPGYEGILWLGLMAPAATPKPVVEQLAAASRRAMQTPDMVERCRRDGIDVVGSTPAEFGERITREIAQWRALGRKVQITLE